MTRPPAPASTYRVQLRGEMTLDAARGLVRYLAELGVSHVYLSPVLRARAGSPHGYDVVDPNAIDPALGGEAAFERFAAAAKSAGVGILLDIVPNHVAADLENQAFADLLMHGPASRFADWFDVDWRVEPGRSHARLVLPALGEPLEEAARNGMLHLVFERGRIRLRYRDRTFPLDPATLSGVLAGAAAALEGATEKLALDAIASALRAVPPRAVTDAVSRVRRAQATAEAERALATLAKRSREARAALVSVVAEFSHGARGLERLARLLEQQAYRLGFWRRAQRTLNYRRFFNVDELIALRVEDPGVFAAVHGAVLERVARGEVAGLRIDHVDGLFDPGLYLTRLGAAVRRRIGARGARAFPILVEKILAHGERLPASWPVEGTTGYDFLNDAEQLFVDASGCRAIEEAWSALAAGAADFAAVALEEKRRALWKAFAADVRRLGALLVRPESPRPQPAPTALMRAIVETIARLRVYRVYTDETGALMPEGRRLLERAFGETRAARAAPTAALDVLARALGLGLAERSLAKEVRERRRAFVARFGQVSGPAAAKGVEDAAFYVHVPLLSRNEVGADPGMPLADAVGAFHRRNAERARDWPATMLALTTHDTKRSSDARSRLDVLSEVASDWTEAVARWRRWNAPHHGRVDESAAPDPNTEYVFYQSLVAIWPIGAGTSRYTAPARDAVGALAERMHAYMEKAAREAGHMTSWTEPNARFERALHAFIDASLTGAASARFVRDVAAFVARVARPGLWNSLAKLVLQLGSPGVADVYQGDELWSFTLVDPDNRRPVDFRLRRALLGEIGRRFDDAPSAAARRAWLARLVAHAEDGRIKLHVLHQGLRLRRRFSELFSGSGYAPLLARGRAERHVVAFARSAGGRLLVVCVPRLVLTLTGDPFADPIAERWEGAELVVPAAFATRRFRCALSGRIVEPTRRGGHSVLACGEIFRALPVAMLVSS